MVKPKRDPASLLRDGYPSEAAFVIATEGGDQTVLFRSLLQLGRAEAVVDAEPADSESTMLRGAALCRVGRHEEGREILEETFRNRTLRDESAYHVAFSYWMLSDMEQARHWLKRAGQNSRAIELEAWVCAYEGRYPEQIKLLQQALPGSTLWNRAAIIRSLAVLTKELYRDDLVTSLRTAMEQTRWTPDLKEFHFHAVMSLAICSALAGNEAQAYRHFREAKRLLPSDTLQILWRVERAMLMRHESPTIANDQTQEAALLADRIAWTNVRGDDRMALLNLARQVSHYDPQKALDFLEIYEDLPPQFANCAARIDQRAEAFLNLTRGYVYSANNRIDDAVKAYKESFTVFNNVGYRWRAVLAMLGIIRLQKFSILTSKYTDYIESVVSKTFPRAWFTKEAVAILRRLDDAELKSINPGVARVLEKLLEGKQYKVIANELNISVKTVESHASAIYEMFDVRTHPELMLFATHRGWISKSQGNP